MSLNPENSTVMQSMANHFPAMHCNARPFILAAGTLLLFWFAPDQLAADAPADPFHTLIDEIWETRLREAPLFATSTGDHRYNDRLPAVSEADCARRHGARLAHLQRLKKIDRQKLAPGDQINYDILLRQLQDKIAEFKFQTHLVPITQRSGFHLDFPELSNNVPLDSVKDFENYIARLRAFGTMADGHVELLRAAISAEQMLPAIVLVGWEQALDAQIVERPEQSLLFDPCRIFPRSVPESAQERLRAEVREAISSSVVPGYRRFREFLENEYVPQARGSIGASALPRGREFYRHRVRKFTTLDLTPEEVHGIGLIEVERIRAEMDKIIEGVDFAGDFSAFTNFLREDPRFYAKSKKELLQEVSLALKRMDGKLPELFGHLPRMPYGLREVPEYIAPRTTAAYYERASGDGTRAGFYYMNTFNLESRPLYTVEALSFHEAVPGHHLQLALQQEIEDLPPFRRYASFTSYIEGWALYAERLGSEVGIYEDPYSDFGRLTMEIWRACRLVVDTGIHYFGWTREQAIEYLRNNSALSLHNIRAEVDRYISWPGQALAYKIGEMKIRELRALAEGQLGELFCLRAFHDTVLASGSVPLDVLEGRIHAWINEVELSQP